jgi:preprotein translocase subunit SecA
MNAIRAVHIYKRDQHYVVRGGNVILVQARSGRLLFGQEFTGGLNQAVQAKEGLAIQGLSKKEVVGTITIKNFVRTYLMAAGTSGNVGSPDELRELYGFETVEIDPFLKTRRDHPDLVYRTAAEKIDGAFISIREASQRGQPVLVSVTTLADVREFAKRLAKENLPFQVLDADTVQTLGEEAECVARAGKSGLVTVCSKTAARGTDIRLEPEAVAAGGLFVVGTDRERDRRYDDQLAGRAARHGEPGDAQFVISLQDDTLSFFGDASMQRLMRHLGMEEGVPIESNFITKRIHAAQRAMYRYDREQRLSVVQRDDILDRHRFVFYRVRQKLLTSANCFEEIRVMLDNSMAQVKRAISKQQPGEVDIEAALGQLRSHLEPIEVGRLRNMKNRRTQMNALAETFKRRLEQALNNAHAAEESFTNLILTVLDELWARYLTFEVSAREEGQLYSTLDPTGIAKYADSMEQHFDSFFYDAGQAILLHVLPWAKLDTPATSMALGSAARA